VVQINTTQPGDGLSLVARPNRSLERRACAGIFIAIGASCMGIAVLAALLGGAWLVLPFAGLEVALLGWAFCALRRHEDDYDRVCVSGDRIDIERRDARHIQRAVLNRQWARLVFRDGHGSGRLVLRSSGREYGFDRFLTDDERTAVALRLRVGLRI
jgi:uncharacterized membrane protein